MWGLYISGNLFGRSNSLKKEIKRLLILLRDGYLQFSTDFQMTRNDTNSILWHVIHA